MKQEKRTESQTPVNQKFEDWMTSHWRPLMAYTYMAICAFDFILGPVMFTIFAGYTSTDLIMWSALTLGGGGLFHLSMGAILGVAAWTRGNEKVERTRRMGSIPPHMNHRRDDDFEVDEDPFRGARG